MIGQFPLWLVLVVWALQRAAQQRVHYYNYAKQCQLIDMVMISLPIPRNRVEEWLMTRALTWFDKEKEALLTLRGVGVVATVVTTK